MGTQRPCASRPISELAPHTIAEFVARRVGARSLCPEGDPAAHPLGFAGDDCLGLRCGALSGPTDSEERPRPTTTSDSLADHSFGAEAARVGEDAYVAAVAATYPRV